MFMAAWLIVAKDGSNLCSSAVQWVKQMYMLRMEYYLAIKTNEIHLFVVSWV